MGIFLQTDVFSKFRKGGFKMSVAQRVQKHHEKLKKVGFKEKCREQSLRSDKADAKDKSLDNLLDTALNDIEGWT